MSNDSGNHWQVSRALPINTDIKCIASVGPVLLAGTSGDGIYRSMDTGKTWLPVNTGLSSKNIQGMAVMGATYYALTDAGIFRTSDAGENWISCFNHVAQSDDRFLIAYQDTLYLATDSVIRLSADSGNTWSDISNGIKSRRLSALFRNPYSFLAGTLS